MNRPEFLNATTVFTFQYVSINTAGYKGAFIRKINFTFQYVSINTKPDPGKKEGDA